MRTNELYNENTWKMMTAWLLLGFVSRVIPHPANMTALMSLSVLGSQLFSYPVTLIIVLLSLLLSDCTLAILLGYPIIGFWSLFTYTGFIAVILLNSFVLPRKHRSSLWIMLLISTCFYWLWTNLGVWMTSGIYSLRWEGLIACYTAALPFLRNALIGNIAWMIGILVSQRYLFKDSRFVLHKHRRYV